MKDRVQSPGRRVRDRVQWAFVALLAAGVLVASLVPGGGRALMGPFGVVGLDKWLHAVGYATLAAAVTVADGRPAVGVAAATAYGALVELLQLGVPYRSGSALDALANLTGAVLGAALAAVALAAYSRSRGEASAHSTSER